MSKRQEQPITESGGSRFPKGAFAMGISWGIAIVSLVAFGGLLIYVLTGGLKPTDQGKVLGADVKTNVNSNANVNPAPAPTPTQPPEPQEDFSKLSPVGAGDYINGDVNAPLTLIEFSDFQCPFCSRHQATLANILKDYPGKVRLVFRHFPLTSIHPYAQKAAEAAECAGEQGKFWEMHDKMFANQNALAIENLKAYAKDLKLDTKKFDECLDAGKYVAKIQKQTQEAISAGVTGTPGTFVGNALVKGAVPYEQFKLVIDQALAQ